MAGISSQALKPLYYENKMRYNGKELQNKEFSDNRGLELYNFGKRMQDSQLGVWHSIDQHTEKYETISPYTYCFDNPIRFFDIKGKDPGDIAVFFTGADFGQGMTCTTLQVAEGVRKQINGGTTITYASFYFLSPDKVTQQTYDEY